MTYKHTLAASYLGYVTQAIVNNLAPLLFLTFQRQLGLSLGMVTALISLNFGVQLLVDLAAARFVDKIGCRAVAVGAHIFCVGGMVCMAVLPFAMPSAYAGLIVATLCNAIGGGLIEVIISPIVEALPGERKAAAMSLLHSFYCWGVLLVALLSTLFFGVVGIERWPWLVLLWALVPLLNSLLFARVPLRTLVAEGEAPVPLRTLFSKKVFILLFVLMICSGASEQAMSQWASLFAELGLGVSKPTGDLLGLCAFAALMGAARLLFGTRLHGRRVENVLVFCGGLCVASYLVTVFSPWPLMSLAGCALCGLSVGVMWPGTFSLAAKRYPRGGTAMFAVLALAGDLGCAGGPGLVGVVSGAFGVGGLLAGEAGQAALKTGILAAAVFPLALVAATGLLRGRKAA
jgi:MFS family permease